MKKENKLHKLKSSADHEKTTETSPEGTAELITTKAPLLKNFTPV